MKTMKKNLLALGIILMSALTFTACSDDDDFYDGKQPEVSTTDVYVSCAGNFGANQGTVGILDYTYKLVQQHLSFIAMLTRNKMASRLVMHKT